MPSKKSAGSPSDNDSARMSLDGRPSDASFAARLRPLQQCGLQSLHRSKDSRQPTAAPPDELQTCAEVFHHSRPEVRQQIGGRPGVRVVVIKRPRIVGVDACGEAVPVTDTGTSQQRAQCGTFAGQSPSWQLMRILL